MNLETVSCDVKANEKGETYKTGNKMLKFRSEDYKVGNVEDRMRE